MIDIVGRASMIELAPALLCLLPLRRNRPTSNNGCDGRRCLRGHNAELRLIFGLQFIPMVLRNRRVVAVLDDVRPHGLGVFFEIAEALVISGPTKWYDAPLVFRFRVANSEPVLLEGIVFVSARARWRGMIFLPRMRCRCSGTLRKRC